MANGTPFSVFGEERHAAREPGTVVLRKSSLIYLDLS